MDRVLELFWPYLWFQDVLSLRAGSCKCRDMVLSPTLPNPPSLPKPITPAPQLPYLPPVDVVEFQLRLQALPQQNPPVNYYAFTDSTPCSSSSTEMPVPSNYVPALPKYPPLDLWLSHWGPVLNPPDTGTWFQKRHKTNDNKKNIWTWLQDTLSIPTSRLTKWSKTLPLRPAVQQSSSPADCWQTRPVIISSEKMLSFFWSWVDAWRLLSPVILRCYFL
jgi:hypothetical protein